MNRRAMMLVVGAAVAVSMLAAVGTAGAQEVSSSPSINETADPTWMTNGVVHSIVRSGDHIYVGGKFTRARSAVSGGQGFAATNLARFDAETGVGDPTWTPDVTGADTATTVYALAAAGGKVWVGGKFDAVDGVPRRNLAAVSEQTGEVDPGVDPLVGSETNKGVRALLASPGGDRVYLGGYFTAIDGKGRRSLGALDPSGNLDPTWKPKVNSYVHSLAHSCDDATVFAGGKFRSAAGSTDGAFVPRQQVARFDANSGSLHPWAIPAGTVGNDEVAADMAITCERITVAFRGPNWTRSLRLDDGNNGAATWAVKSGGEAQTLTMLGPDKLIIGGHFSNFNEGVKTPGVALVNLSDGTVDLSWAPTLTAGGNKFISIWETFVDEDHVYIGGLFNSVEGTPRTNFARFTFTP